MTGDGRECGHQGVSDAAENPKSGMFRRIDRKMAGLMTRRLHAAALPDNQRLINVVDRSS